MKRRMLMVWMAALALTCFLPVQAGEPPGKPDEFIEDVTHALWQALAQNREHFAQDPKALKAFVEKAVLPHVAVEKMARYAMGKFWRKASRAQQQRFVAAFTDMLLRSYANTLLNLKIQSMRVAKVVPGKRGRYQVEQQVVRENAPETKVVYRVYWDKKAQRWKIYDVVAENVSLLLNYRKVFTTELQKKGIDQVIEELEAKNQAFLQGQSTHEGANRGAGE